MPRLPVKQRAAENVSTQLPDGRCCARANDVPPPSSWDSHGNCLLSNLPPDKAKRVKILEKTISSLKAKREEFRREKKTGASVATEALEFYSHVLEMNQSWKGKSTSPSKTVAKKIEKEEQQLQQQEEEKDIRVEDAHCASIETNQDETDRHRGKRQRRQPILFDPQTCSASAWVGESPNRGQSEKSTPTPASSDPWRSWKKDQNPQFFNVLQNIIQDKRDHYSFSKQNECKYCRADENVHVCCFCACRICFVKCDKSQTILCDICNADFHTYCLVPPVDPIPKDEWYCPSCISAINASLENKLRAHKGDNDRIVLSTEDGEVKRGPGRPRHNETMKDTHTAKMKKEARVVSSGLKSEEKMNVDRRKSPRSLNERLTKPTSDEKPQLSSEESAVLADSPHRSRSGRLLKKNNFYDQAEEKDQHLRSATRLLAVDADEENSYPESTSPSIPKEFKRSVSEGAFSAQNMSEASLGNDGATVGRTPFMESGPESMKDVKSSESLKRSFESHLDHVQLTDSHEPSSGPVKVPRRKPGARECMQLSRRFGVNVIPQKYIDILLDYCNRGKVEHLIRMRERLDEHSTFLELQLASFEALVQDMNEESSQVKADIKTDNTD